MTYQKPLPVADVESAPFWNATRRGELLAPECKKCGKLRFPPTTYCPYCQSNEATWVALSGRGAVFSWIVVRHPVPKEIYGADVPYVVALIELEEGVRIVSNIVDCAPEAVQPNAAVRVRFERVTDEITLPLFVLV